MKEARTVGKWPVGNLFHWDRVPDRESGARFFHEGYDILPL